MFSRRLLSRGYPLAIASFRGKCIFQYHDTLNTI
eukprot:COSAG02_NODE_5559_length_4229_cov_143.642373_1_plen_33_part_10